MRTGGLSITHTNVTDTFQWPGASLLSSTNVRLSAVMSELEIVANGPSSDPVQHFTVLGVQGNNKAFKCLYCDKELSGTATRCYVHLTGECGRSGGVC